MPFAVWKQRLADLLRVTYKIDIDKTQLSDDKLRKYHAWGESPEDIAAEHFAEIEG